MSKTATLVVFASCAMVVAGALTGCSAGALPGGSPAVPGITTAPTQPAAKSVAPEDDLTAVPTECPKAQVVSALLGVTVPDPIPNSDSTGLACTYEGGGETDYVEINFEPAPAGSTAASVRAQLDSGASTEGNVAPVSGLGQAAFSTAPTAGGVGLLVWNKGVEFSIVDFHDLDSLRRIALGVLAE